jgi:hypothetical protein
VSPVGTRRRLRRLVRVSAVVGAPVATALAAGPATAVGVVVVGALLWGLWRWPRWEARLFGSSCDVELPSQVWAPPRREAQDTGAGLGPAGHRAFARALHAVAEAYLAECEREEER